MGRAPLSHRIRDGTDAGLGETVGAGVFCLKLCFDNTQKEPFYCQNKFDLLGCSYSAFLMRLCEL